MRLLDKMERKFGKIAIPNLMMLIIVGMFVVYVVNLFFPQINLMNMLSLDTQRALSGEYWRFISFIFLPPNSSIWFILFSLFFYYWTGNSLEQQWGTFKFNVYYFIGIIGIIIASFIAGYGLNFYLNISLFLAFAVLFPEHEIMFMFILRIKVKYLAMIEGVSLLILLLIRPWYEKISIIASLINFVIFFGPDLFKHIRDSIKYNKVRKNYNNTVNRR